MKTWQSTSGEEKLWLRDDLPSELPDVRVLIYEYNSDPLLSPTKQRLVNEASELLLRLDIKRSQVKWPQNSTRATF